MHDASSETPLSTVWVCRHDAHHKKKRPKPLTVVCLVYKLPKKAYSAKLIPRL